MTHPDPGAEWPVTRYLRTGILATIFLVAGFGTWIARANIAGAIVTTGRLEIVEEPQIIQHATGGVVEHLTIREGDPVQTNDVLMRLDSLLVHSSLKIANYTLFEIMARRARLTAERDSEEIRFDPLLKTLSQTDLAVAGLLDDQIRLLSSSSALQNQVIDGLHRKTAQITSRVAGIRAQERAIVIQQSLVTEQLEGKTALVDRGLTPASAVLALKREVAILDGRLGTLAAEIAEAAERITEIEIDILKIHSTRQEQAISRLRDLEFREIELREDRRLLQKSLADHIIRAPVAGTVLGLAQLSPGSVVPAGKTLMTIVPQDGEFVIRTQVQPSNINQIYPGQQVRIRFALLGSVDASDTDFAGTVRSVSPDILSETQTGKPYYRVEIAFSDLDMTASNAAFTFTPGMPVEVYFATTIQPIWAYLAKPLIAYMSRAFRET